MDKSWGLGGRGCSEVERECRSDGEIVGKQCGIVRVGDSLKRQTSEAVREEDDVDRFV